MAQYFLNPVTNSGNLFLNPFVDAVDLAPEFVGGITASSIDETSFNVNYTLNETSDSYLIVVAQGSATPTPAQIKAGVDYGAVTVLFSATDTAAINTQETISVTGLTGYEGQQVTVWMTAEDLQDNLQTQSGIRSVTVTLQSVNLPPVSSGNYSQQQAIINTSFSFNGAANFSDDDTLTYSLSGLDGATINATTGIIDWIPTSLGVFQGTVTATDQANQSASADLPINVVELGEFWDFSVPIDCVITFR
jgi:hypothetical protein